MSKLGDSKVITCKAVVCWGIGEALKVEEIQIEPPKSSEVRVKILYASVCHTDLLYTKGFPAPAFPRVLGHEGVGVVESVGEEVTDVKAGDFVIPTYMAQCQDCEYCVSGKTNLCLKYPLPVSGLMTDGTSRMSVRGQRLYQAFSCSTWSEYMVVDAIYVLKIDPSIIDLPHASFLSCGFSTGFGAAWKEAGVEQGSSVAVLGLGAVGLGAIEGARKQGAVKIIGIDKNEKKRKKGEAFGMTHFINPSDDENDQKSISEQVKELTGGIGVDYCFECTGAPLLLNQALLATKMGKGQAILIGAGNHSTVEVSSLHLLLGGTLKGSAFGGLKPQTDLPVLIDKCKNKEFQLGELLSHEISLDDADKAFDLMKHPDCVKILIKL
ncbi:8-hydroxygeraniol oxidoreductase-like [Juglans microcarpa x Juglans regia]|uniref:8-hydroxygeraniol oxidoreductase-like n=1 Tax=Juglans microcarpa x Juglans regia TaxID=2249226 RepID=UPI001B7EAA69|nr:8-hydroxygeraniol oxidoreductase-like [Juglans microcarpa x Juglans regia]